MITALILIGLLVSLVLVHEFGHFIIAKLFGITVEEFSIFFPPRLLSKTWRGTKYTLGLIPLGGYVKIFGEDASEARTPEENSLAREGGGRDGRSEDFFGRSSGVAFDKQNFSHRSRFIQAAVIVAGVVFNVIFAWLILSVGYVAGMHTPKEHQGIGQVEHSRVTILNILPHSPAETSGIKPNDTIESIQTGTATLPAQADANTTQQFIFDHQDESMVVTLLRDGKQVYALTKPVEGLVLGHKALGIELDDVGVLRLSPPLALVQGAVLTYDLSAATVAGFASLIGDSLHGQGDLSGVAGPIGIARIGSSAVAQGFEATIILTALVSLNLALINLLPIPGLDGGRLLFIAIEGIRRRALSEMFITRVTIASFIFIGLLVILISYHDIVSWMHP